MNAILKEIKERADYAVNEKWVLEFYEGSYFGMNMHVTYTGNMEACFLQMRRNCLKETGIDLLENQINILIDSEEITKNVGKNVELLFDDFLDNDTLWMTKLKKYERDPDRREISSFEKFCSENAGESLDVLIEKWDSLSEEEFKKFVDFYDYYDPDKIGEDSEEDEDEDEEDESEDEEETENDFEEYYSEEDYSQEDESEEDESEEDEDDDLKSRA